MKKRIFSHLIPPLYKRLLISGSFLIGSAFLFLTETPRTVQLPNIADVKSPQPVLESQIEVCFTPNKKCQRMIVEAIDSAKESIYVQAYSLTDPDIINALREATLRGIDVKLLVDQSVFKGKGSALERSGHPYEVRIDRVDGLAHNKIMIIDSLKVIGGSYNFSKGGYAKNAENVLFIDNSNITQKYKENFLARWKEGMPVSPKNLPAKRTIKR